MGLHQLHPYTYSNPGPFFVSTKPYKLYCNDQKHGYNASCICSCV